MKCFITLAMIAAIFGCTAKPTKVISGKVVGVADGDTITILDKNNTQYKIRFSGIDCPESHQDWGNNAKKITSKIVFGINVDVAVVDTDRYGRTVGTVFANGANVNRYLVQKGHCWRYPRYAKDKKLFELHDQAKESRKGLWSLPKTPIPPWEFRRKK